MQGFQPLDVEQFQDRGYQSYQGFVQQSKAMLDIVHNMKEIPVLPSEIPKRGDNHSLERVEFPPEGGILTYMTNYVRPYRGFPYFTMVEKIDLIKKICRPIQSGFYHAFKYKWYLIPLLILLFPLARPLIWAFTYGFHWSLQRTLIKKDKYSKAVAEIYRVWSLEQKESEWFKSLRLMMRDIECSILEFDNAWRFRAQDVLPELNKQALQANSVREIKRLIDILISREIRVEYKDTWRLLKMFVDFYLRFDRKLLRMFVNILSEVNLNEVELTAEDKPFALGRKDYMFGFMQGLDSPNLTRTQKIDLHLFKQQELREKYLEKRFAIEDESTVEHEKIPQVTLTKEQNQIWLENMQKLNQVYVGQQNELHQKYLVQVNELEKAVFTEEQKQTIKENKQKLQELDQVYTQKLLEIDNKYESDKKELAKQYVST